MALQYLIRREHGGSWSQARSLPGTPHESPRASAIGHYHPRRSSVSTSRRFGAFQARPSTASHGNGPRMGCGASSAKGTLHSARCMEWRQSLRSRLGALKATVPLAGVFERQIDEEIEGGEAVTHERLVGLVRYLPQTEGMGSNSNHGEVGANVGNSFASSLGS